MEEGAQRLHGWMIIEGIRYKTPTITYLLEIIKTYTLIFTLYFDFKNVRTIDYRII